MTRHEARERAERMERGIRAQLEFNGVVADEAADILAEHKDATALRWLLDREQAQHEEAVALAVACLRNSGIDANCGACMEVAFTGVTMAQHTCRAEGSSLRWKQDALVLNLGRARLAAKKLRNVRAHLGRCPEEYRGSNEPDDPSGPPCRFISEHPDHLCTVCAAILILRDPQRELKRQVRDARRAIERAAERAALRAEARQ